MPPSLWWFSFNPCLSICSSPDLSASYILPPGFSHHLKQSLKIWLQKKTQQRLGTRWDTSMCSFFRHFSSMIQDFFFAQLLCFYLFFLLEATMNKKTELTVCLFFQLICTLFWRKTQYLLSHSGIIKEMHFSSACTIASGSSYSHSVSGLCSACFS